MRTEIEEMRVECSWLLDLKEDSQIRQNMQRKRATRFESMVNSEFVQILNI